MVDCFCITYLGTWLLFLFGCRTFVMPSRMCINPIHNKKGLLHQSTNASSEERCFFPLFFSNNVFLVCSLSCNCMLSFLQLCWSMLFLIIQIFYLLNVAFSNRHILDGSWSCIKLVLFGLQTKMQTSLHKKFTVLSYICDLF